tara:strand:+ start:1098 stop:1451 length:354 start_codon:yes stop_codon:yes gene_type:complete
MAYKDNNKATPITFKASALKQTFRADLTSGAHHKKFKDHSDMFAKEEEKEVVVNSEEKDDAGITPPSDPPKDANEEGKGNDNMEAYNKWLETKGADGQTGQEIMNNLTNLFKGGGIL